MVLPPFEASRAKIANAGEHIARVILLFEAYQQDAPMEARVEELADGGKGINFVPSKPLPVTTPLAVGDAIHNLRSAMDIMAGDVVRPSGGNAKGVLFPFANEENDYDIQIKKKNFHRASPEAIQLLKSMKPYTGRNIELRALHDLDLTDKHNWIIPTSRSATVPRMKIGGMIFIDCELESNEYDILVDAGVPCHITGPVFAQLAFSYDGPLPEQKVIATLHSLSKNVTGVVEAFATLFGRGI